MLDFIIRLGVKFSNEDREKCFGVAKRMIKMAHVAYEQGILGLSGVITGATSNDFTIMVVEIFKIGYDSETLKKALEYSLMTSNHTSEELLERVIIAESFIIIADSLGHTTDGSLLTKSVAVSTGALLGEKYILPLIRYADSLETASAVDVNMVIKEHTIPVSASGDFEDKIYRLSKVNLYYVFTTFSDIFQVATALMGCSETFLRYIRRSLPENTIAQLFMTLEFLLPQNEKVISEAQALMMTYIEVLEAKGVLQYK